MLRRLAILAALVPLTHLVACGGSDAPGATATARVSSRPPSTGTGPSVEDIMSSLPQSCAFTCQDCAEPDTPFDCPTVKPWETLPHDDACGTWDGPSPAPAKGKCTASDPSGESVRKTGPFAGGIVLPDGHRITPAGREVELLDPDLVGGYPMSLLRLAGAGFAGASDGGLDDDSLRLLDLDALATAAGDPV